MTLLEKELIEVKLKGVFAHISASNDIQNEVNIKILDKLDIIIERVDYTNGKVAENIKQINSLKLGAAVVYQNCPLKSRVSKVEKRLYIWGGGLTVLIFMIGILVKFL